MRKIARENPLGLPVPKEVTLVRVGKEGQFTHIYNPQTGAHLCRSGIKHGRIPTLYRSNGRELTCYRCAKLAQINARAGGPSRRRG